MIRCVVFFFFQAEDGIRDLVRSRGLGDVYKRQGRHRTELMLLNDAVDDNGRGWRQWNVVTGQALNLSLIHI